MSNIRVQLPASRQWNMVFLYEFCFFCACNFANSYRFMRNQLQQKAWKKKANKMTMNLSKHCWSVESYTCSFSELSQKVRKHCLLLSRLATKFLNEETEAIEDSYAECNRLATYIHRSVTQVVSSRSNLQLETEQTQDGTLQTAKVQQECINVHNLPFQSQRESTLRKECCMMCGTEKEKSKKPWRRGPDGFVSYVFLFQTKLVLNLLKEFAIPAVFDTPSDSKRTKANMEDIGKILLHKFNCQN